MEMLYQKLSLDEIPWHITETPEALIELIKSEKIKPRNILDLGCGTGNYVLFFASQGYDVTGVDISPSALQIARKYVDERNLDCRFIVADVLGDLSEVKHRFDFAYDWELLHHIYPDQRQHYIQNVYHLLNPGGHYLSLCFSEKDPQFGGEGKYRKTPIGTVLYFSSEQELIALFKPLFDIIELKTIEIRGKKAPHLAIYAFMKKAD
jgi:SAM-dependent methyltransferase